MLNNITYHTPARSCVAGGWRRRWEKKPTHTYTGFRRRNGRIIVMHNKNFIKRGVHAHRTHPFCCILASFFVNNLSLSLSISLSLSRKRVAFGPVGSPVQTQCFIVRPAMIGRKVSFCRPRNPEEAPYGTATVYVPGNVFLYRRFCQRQLITAEKGCTNGQRCKWKHHIFICNWMQF